MDKLEQADIEQRLADFPEWSQNGDSLQRTFGFDDFVAAMEFVNSVAATAESHQHHPDILIRYNKVMLTLETHDAGGLTDKDFNLARAVDGLVPATKS
jgi:4a-hydroxytetrahydrobiopterin dehydratase